MAAKKSHAAMEFIVESLKNDPTAAYKDIAEAAAKRRLKVYPIMFGRAQALLGIVRSAPRGTGKYARARAEQEGRPFAPAPRHSANGRGRQAETPFTGSLDGIVAAVKTSEQSKQRYRTALERIQAILADALA